MYPQHHRFQVWSTAQHPYRHSLAELDYTNPALPTGQPQNAESAMNWLFAVIYPQTQPSVATPAALPAAGNTINDYRVVLDDGDGKAAAYRWEKREGDALAKWYKIYDMDWGESSILSNFLLKTQDVYVYKYGIDDLDDSGVALTGDDAGQSVYGGQTANTHLSLYANSGDGVGAGTGYVQVGDNFRPKVDDTYTSGTPTYRWSHIYTMLATVNTMGLATGSITDSTGAIDFDDEDLSTTGTVTVDTMLIQGGSITDTSGAIDFGNENLSTTGFAQIGATKIADAGPLGTITTTAAMFIGTDGLAGPRVSSMNIVGGNVTIEALLAVTGKVNIQATNSANFFFANENKPVTFSQNIQINRNAISIIPVDTDLTLAANGTGVIDMQSAMTTIDQTVTGIVDITGQLDVDDVRIDGNTLSVSTVNTDLNIAANGTGFIRPQTSILPSVNSAFHLGFTGSVWDSIYFDGVLSDGVTSVSSATVQSLRSILTGVALGDSIFWDGSKWVASAPDTEIDHGSISGLGDDDHTQYALLAGRAGGQVLIGGTVASNNLTLESTSDATKGSVIFRDTLRPDVDDTTDIGTASFRVKDLYMSGEGIGFRLENAANFASLPAPSVSNKGRTAWVDDSNTVYVDDGGVWVAAAVAGSTGVWTKYTFSYTDFAAAATTLQIDIFSLGVNEVIEGINVKHSTSFSGGGSTFVNLRIGIAADDNRFTNDFVASQAVSDTAFETTSVLDYVSAAVTAIRIRLTSDVNTNTLTQGDVSVWVKTSSIPS